MKKILLIICLVWVVVFGALAQDVGAIGKTNVGGDLYNFANYKSLDEYTLKYRGYIKKFRPNLTELEMENLAPLDVKKIDKSCSQKIGFLLLHGLSDSPFSVSDIRKEILQNQPCVVVKSPILPGHALIAGASLEEGYQDWINLVNFAVSDFKNEGVDRVVAVGFSTGGALVLNQVLNGNKNIVAVAFFSPAFDIGLPFYEVMALKFMDFISNFKPLNSLAYLEKHSEDNVYKYESFSFHGINNLYKIIQINNKLVARQKTIDVPAFFAFSDVDKTVKAAKIIAMINDNFSRPEGVIFSNQGVASKASMRVIKPLDLQQKILDLSHVALPFSESNYFYGKNAKVNHGCLEYDEKGMEDKFLECRKFASKFYYGEITKENLAQYEYVSRITYNPYFKETIVGLNWFIGQNR